METAILIRFGHASHQFPDGTVTGARAPRLATLPAQKRLSPELRPEPHLGFVLYGGAAVALHLGHRSSPDVDFLRARRLDRAAIRKGCPFLQKATVLQDTDDMLVVHAPGRGKSSVKVSFVGSVGFGRIGDPLLTEDGCLLVASLDDLMAHALKALLERREKKDYEDVAAMIRAGCSVSRGLAGARLLHGKAFQPAAALKALAFFEGGDLVGLSAGDRRTLASAARVVGILPRVKLRSRSLTVPLAGER